MASSLNAIASILGVSFGNVNDYPVLGNSYCVILGKFITSFSKISGIVLKSSQLIAINEGGNNKPYIVPDIKTDFNHITFEKGYGTLDIMKMVDQITVVTILIRDQRGNIIGAYYTDRAVVKQVELSDLSAKDSEPIIQKLTIAYNNLKQADKIMDTLSVLNAAGQTVSDLFNSDGDAEAAAQRIADQVKQKKEEKKLAEAQKKAEELKKAAAAKTQDAAPSAAADADTKDAAPSAAVDADTKDAAPNAAVDADTKDAAPNAAVDADTKDAAPSAAARKTLSNPAIAAAASRNQAVQKSEEERMLEEELENFFKIEF